VAAMSVLANQIISPTVPYNQEISHKLKQSISVACLVKARTMEQEKHPFLGNGCVTCNNGVTVRSGVFCAVRADIM
jgi:hypothetical protein